MGPPWVKTTAGRRSPALAPRGRKIWQGTSSPSAAFTITSWGVTSSRAGNSAGSSRGATISTFPPAAGTVATDVGCVAVA